MKMCFYYFIIVMVIFQNLSSSEIVESLAKVRRPRIEERLQRRSSFCENNGLSMQKEGKKTKFICTHDGCSCKFFFIMTALEHCINQHHAIINGSIPCTYCDENIDFNDFSTHSLGHRKNSTNSTAAILAGIKKGTSHKRK